MKRTSTFGLPVFFTLCLVGITVFAHDDERISFATVQSTERAKAILHENGLRVFMDRVWAQGVTAPGIHSKYWLDQFTRDKPELYAIEKAYRDFGYELAIQIEDLAFEIYEKPDKSLEMERLDWLLRFSKWMLKPGKFENLRIGARVEEAATMPLLRVMFNFDIPTTEIESCFDRFNIGRENATLRATVLYEESNGVLDVRDLAEKAQEGEDDGFEARWASLWVKAYRHFGEHILNYTTDSEILFSEEIKYNFFMDDTGDLGGRNSIPERWNGKYHKEVCVLGGRVWYLRQIHYVLIFRKDIGKFPDVVVPEGKDILETYQKYYFKKFRWDQRLTTADTTDVAYLYLQFKHNEYMDHSTMRSYETRNKPKVTIEEFESRPSTKMRRARNQQWLKKHRKSK